MKKELKKISLRKEELVNLNSPEMDSIKGGSSWPCAASASIASYLSTKVADQAYDHYVSSYVESIFDAIDSYASAAWDWLTGSGEEGSEEEEPTYDGGTLPELTVTP